MGKQFRKKLYNRQGGGLGVEKLSNDDLENMYKLVSNGIPYSVVAKLYGTTKKTIYDWLSYGEKFVEQPAHIRNIKHLPNAIFSHRMKKAKAVFIARLIDSVNDTSRKNKKWDRDFKILKLRDQGIWGKNSKDDFTMYKEKNADDSFL